MTTIGRILSMLALASPLGAQPKSTFVITKGKDTVAVEAFSRDQSVLTSEIYQATGVQQQYTATLGRNEAIKYVELTRRGRQGQTVGITVVFGDTTVSATMSGPGETEKFTTPSKGHETPFLAVSFALCEQILRASHLDVGNSQRWTAFRLGAGDTASLTVTRFHTDSALFAMPDVQLKVAISPNGEVVGGRNVGQDWLITRRR